MTRIRHEDHMPQIKDPHHATPATNRLVARWKSAHVESSEAKKGCDAARKEVFSALTVAGIDHLVTAYGTIEIQRQTYVDWEALARSTLAPDVIDAMREQYTKTSAPYVAAPRGWSSEAKKAEPVRTKRRPSRAAARLARR